MPAAMNELNLSGKTALVCGASQGIGKAVATQLASMGAKVIALARTEASLQELIKSLPGSGHIALAADLSDRKALAEKLAQLLKNQTVQIIINNTGGPKGGSLLDASDDEFLNAFGQHILSAELMVKACLPGMKSAHYGRVINIISTSVKAPIPLLGVSNTIRGAMANWSKTLAMELGPFGITVNNVLPGFTKTPRMEALRKGSAERLKISESEVEANWKSAIPMGRFAEPSEVAAAVCFLASPWASYINGINVPVDGGRTQSL